MNTALDPFPQLSISIGDYNFVKNDNEESIRNSRKK